MISILMPVYNTNSLHLQLSLNSCLSQTFSEFEVIVINNQSDQKDTLKVLDRYSMHKKIKIYDCPRQKNKKNLSVALNCGLKKCNFNLIARMDSDDIMLDNRLEKQLNYFNKNNVDILGGQIKFIDSMKRSLHPRIITKDIIKNHDWFINHPTVLYKKNKILSIGGYLEEPEFFAEDYELWTRSLINNFSIHNLDDIVLFYREHENNLTKQMKLDSSYNLNMMNIKKNFLEELKKNDTK